MRGKTIISSSPVLAALALLLPALGRAETGTCVGSQGECQGSALLQHGFAAGRREANMAVEHDHATNKASAKTTIPRHDLTNMRVPLHTDLEVAGDQHNRCTGSSPDGRLFLCGFSTKYLRYFKFESMTFTPDDGVPIFNDGVWAGADQAHVGNIVGDPGSISWCWPDRSKPFEKVIDNGQVLHVYTMLALNTVQMRYMTVKVLNPYSADAQIINWTLGIPLPMKQRLPRFHSISADGKLIVGSDGDDVSFLALSESAEACSVCSEAWSLKRPIHEMHSDPDGLNLKNRYGLAKYPLTDAIGQPFQEGYNFTGKYTFLDLEARNLFIGDQGGVRMIGADTLGAEYLPDGGINQDGAGQIRYWTSFWWNFESLRTKAQRFEGEEHTSGVDGPTGFQLPMTSDPGAFTMMNGMRQYYTELNVRSIKEAANDILNLPMSTMWVPKPDRSYMPAAGTFVDLSRNRFQIESSTARWEINRTSAVPTAVQGFGYSVRLTKGTLRIPLGDQSASTPGLARPTPALSVLASVRPNNRLGGTCERPIISHPSFSLTGRREKLTWVFNGQQMTAGDFVSKEWVNVAFVFDGASGVISIYSNGVLLSQSSTDVTEFQFTTDDMIIGDEVFERRGTCSYEGWIGDIRIAPRALTGVEICDAAQGADCKGSINFQVTNTQLKLSQQDPDCNATSLNTLACSHAMHRVCYNYVAMKESVDKSVSGTVLTDFGSAKIPVSMGGMPLSITGSQVELACTPFAGPHLSVPVEFFDMQKYEPQCLPVTDGSYEMLYCNMAAHGFCKAAMAEHEPSSDPALVTGVVYEVDSRAWVTCFEADKVLPSTKATLSGCDDLGSSACMLSASRSCNDDTATTTGVIQAVDGEQVKVHCFSPPVDIGMMTVPF